MYETGQSQGRSRDELRAALARLDEALARHAGEKHIAAEDPADPALQVLQRSVELMRLEAERLRALLAED